MKFKQFLIQHSYIYLITILLATFVSALVNSFLNLNVNSFIVLLFTILSNVIIITFSLNKKKIFTYIIIGAIVIITTIVINLLNISFYSKAKGFINWWSEFDNNDLEKSNGYALFSMILIIFIISIVCYFLQKKVQTRFFCGIIVLGALIILGFFEYNSPKIITACTIFYIFMILTEFSIALSYKNKTENERKETIAFLLSVLLIFSVLTSLLPSSQKPIQWTFVKKTIKNVGTLISDISSQISLWGKSGNSEFSMRMTGFSENGEIGGDVQQSDAQQLIVEIHKIPHSGIYLSGSISDTYTGRGWKKTNEYEYLGIDEYAIDSLELMYSLYNANLFDNADEIFSKYHINITYDGISTRSVFYPLKTYDFNVPNSDFSMNYNKPNVFFDDKKVENANYSLSYMALNLYNDKFVDFIHKQQAYEYSKDNIINGDEVSIVAKYKFKKLPCQIPDNFEEILKNRVEDIENTYVQLPEDIPQRVVDLSYDLTKEYDNDYDKLKAIEGYLNTYTYSLTPGNIPEDSDVVDYFLFEKNEGYCTYFATSMAVMGRYIGIPTRYVEGFATDLENPIDFSKYGIKGYNAHAWVEAYIEGVGWVPFEPTPTYFDYRYYEKPDVTYNPTKPLKDYTDQYKKDAQDTQSDILLTEIESTPDENKINVFFVIGISILIIVVLAFIAVFMCFNVKIKTFKKRYRNSDNNEKYYINFVMIMKILKRCKIKVHDGETLLSFATRINPYYKTENTSFLDIAKIYMSMKYGRKIISEKELEKIMELKEFVGESVLNQIGKTKYRILMFKMM